MSVCMFVCVCECVHPLSNECLCMSLCVSIHVLACVCLHVCPGLSAGEHLSVRLSSCACLGSLSECACACLCLFVSVSVCMGWGSGVSANVPVNTHGVTASYLIAQVERLSHREGISLPGILWGVSGILGNGTSPAWLCLGA